MRVRRQNSARIASLVWALITALLAGSVLPALSVAEPLTTTDFQQTWAREDGPVASGSVSRTWLWGPEPFTPEISEAYGGATRTVQYFDKARMEINDPLAARDRWFVTTGLLAAELVTGAMQVSDSGFEQRGPAITPVAGDSDDPLSPTYASFDRVRNHDAFNTGTTLTATINRQGDVSQDQRYAGYAVRAQQLVPETGHSVASVFWEYLNTTGPVIEDGAQVTGRLFEPWFYATGLPITEAYWADVLVAGERMAVLTQVFERRVLTYTPSHDPEWRVELGNVGRHYYDWRNLRDLRLPVGVGSALWTPDQETIQIDVEAHAEAGVLQLVAQYWHGGRPLPEGGYRVEAEVRLGGPAEAGLGTRLNVVDGGLHSVVYSGVDVSGARLLTVEGFATSSTIHLLRPGIGVPGWDQTPGAWNRIAVTVFQGWLWFEVGGRVAGVVELQATVDTPGIALLVAHSGQTDGFASAEFRNVGLFAVEGR